MPRMHKPDPDLSWNFPEAISRRKRDRIARFGVYYAVAHVGIALLIALLL